MNDLCLAAEALKANLRLVALKREPGWIRPLAEKQDDSLWLATRLDDRAHSDFMRDLLSEYVLPTGADWWKRS